MTLEERVRALDWYHSIELAPGVVTPGFFDHRRILGRVELPLDLSGKRCLDVATFDGFWAFEMERRGAAEVAAIDVLDPRQWDWPANAREETIESVGRRKAEGRGFDLAHEALGSSVQRVELNVYDLDESSPGGTFDFVFLGSLLMHLRDPVRALGRVRDVCRGELLVVDNVHLGLVPLPGRVGAASLDGAGRPWWWKPNRRALVNWVEAAGFEVVRGPTLVLIPPGHGRTQAALRPSVLRHRAGRQELLASRVGDPHAALLARPL